MHITVCVCTYRRPELLRRLLWELGRQETGGLFTHSVVVVDNDREESARGVVDAMAGTSPVPIVYRVESEQGIARARNRAVEAAEGDFIAFIDDDECPVKDWLLLLFRACLQHGVDGALGPVKPHFESEPPRWLIRGGFYERADYPTGFVIDGAKGRTGNVLLRRSLFRPGEAAFRTEFVTGEDQDLFRRLIAAGHVFIWCSEAVAYETVPPVRWKRWYLMRKAMMRGKYSVIEPSFGVREAVTSVVAIPAYAAALPVACLLGQHQLARCLVRLWYHTGKILACLGIDPAGRTYVSD